MLHSAQWQELFDQAAEPRTTASGNAASRVSLASVDSGSSSSSAGQQVPSGTGGLQHSGGPWTRASSTADALRNSSEAGRSRLGATNEGVASGGRGLASLAALKVVRESWEERLSSVRGECGYMKGVLLKVAKEMGETDAAVDRDFSNVKKGRLR